MLWKGYNWDKRSGGGGPGYGTWSTSNVVDPDGNDYVTLKITNPTGNAPIGAEMIMTESLGYGTYTIVTGSRLDTLDKNIVFGNLFPYYGGSPFIEFDVGEVASWDGGGDFGGTTVYISHNTWYNGAANRHHNSAIIGSSVTHTFVFTWSPGRAEYWTYEGVGTGGTLLLHSVHTTNVPVPSTEVPIINLWVYNNSGSPVANDLDAPATDVILRDFTYAPLSGSSSASKSPSASASASKSPSASSSRSLSPSASKSPSASASPSASSSLSKSPSASLSPSASTSPSASVSPSASASPSSAATIALDSSATSISNGFSGTTTKTWSLNNVAGNLLVLEADIWQDVAGTGTITAASYNGVALTKVTNTRGGGMATETWYLKSPATGVHTMSVTVTGNTDAIKLTANTFSGADIVSPLDTFAIASGSSGNPTVSVTTGVSNALVISTLSRYSTTAATSNRSSLYNDITGSTLGAASYQVVSGIASYSDTYTGPSATDWSMIITSFKASSLGSSPSASLSPSASASPSLSPSSSQSPSASVSLSLSPSSSKSPSSSVSSSISPSSSASRSLSPSSSASSSASPSTPEINLQTDYWRVSETGSSSISASISASISPSSSESASTSPSASISPSASLSPSSSASLSTSPSASVSPSSSVSKSPSPSVPPGRLKYWNGSQWVACPVKYFSATGGRAPSSSPWFEKPLKAWNGSSWIY